MTVIDLNCDLAEGCGADEAVMPFITSASIACGFHAGDAVVISETLRAAARHRVRIGAHPSFSDRAGFGRKEMTLPASVVFRQCVYQIGAVDALARAAGLRLSYVKPHGALYNMACRDEAVAAPVADAAAVFGLALMGLPGSGVERVARGRGLRFLAEGFADRRYRPDGSLVPRTQADAMITDPAEAVEQAERLVRDTPVRSLCVHGDNPAAIEFVRALRSALESRGFSVGPAEPTGTGGPAA